MARQRWWPMSLPEQYQKVKDIQTKIGNYAIPLGLTPAQVTAIEERCAAFLGAYDFRSTSASTDHAVTEWRDQVFYGEPKGDPVSPAPVYPVIGAVTYTRGTVNQIFDDRDYVLALPGYTDAIGEDLGYIGAEVEPPAPGTIQPSLKVEAAAQGNFAFAAIVGNRGDSDQWVLSAAPVGTSDWQQLDIFTGKTGDAAWPINGLAPIQLQCRAQLRKKNQNYGIPSDIVTVTVIP